LVSDEENSGGEIKVYEDSREPQAWNELLAPSQCAVFFKRVHSEIPLSPNGTPFAKLRDATFLRFDSLEEARRFCEARVELNPGMCCEIFDSRGKAQPPLLVIAHPSVAKKDELSASSLRTRKVLAILLFVSAGPLFWWDRRAHGTLVLPTFLGLTIIVIGVRILHWNMTSQERIRDQAERVQSHLRRERESLRESAEGQQSIS
jgi:hypothetical protein